VRWDKRGARENTFSPGIIFTPSRFAREELRGPPGEGYRRTIERSATGRGGTPDEVGTVRALLMGPDGAFITGSDFRLEAESRLPSCTANLLRSDGACMKPS
jgi:NAD(P)-dependent dehydrogenase (short-subunit alcohol dehydrogenase family)